MAKLYEVHDEWGEDSLSAFQHAAISNEIHTHSIKGAFNSLLSELDSLIYESALKAAPAHKAKIDEGSLLFFCAHNHFRAAARLCLSGQFLPVYPVARASIENALYGWKLSTDQSLVRYWLNKPDMDEREKLRAWNKTFGFSNLSADVGEMDSRVEEILKHLHQTTIDFGGHPNMEALYSNLMRLPNVDEVLYTIAYVQQEGKLLYFTSSLLLDVALTNWVLIKLAHPTISKDKEFLSRYNSLAHKVKEFQTHAYGEMGWEF